MKQFDKDTDEMQMSEDYKPTYIKEQHNNNCQQFFGPITNCTFTMPAASKSSNKKSKTAKPNKLRDKITRDKPKTLKYYKHGKNSVLMKQRKRVLVVFRKWNEWGWIDDKTAAEDFDSFFEGEPKHCNITWTASTTILTILMQELLKQPYIEKQTKCTAKSLVVQQFEKTPNYDKTRLDADSEEKIIITLLILDIRNPLPEQHGRNNEEEFDIKDEALREVYTGKLRSTKGV